jgi:tetratricopeptide (TPR) repeat protein
MLNSVRGITSRQLVSFSALSQVNNKVKVPSTDAGQAKDSEIVAAIDKLMNDFAGDAGLAEAVYWISKEYEWKKGTSLNRSDWYNTPNSVYAKIMQEFGDTPFGIEAEWDQKRLTHRMKIFKLLSEPNQDATDAAIEAMAADLKGRPELANELYWLACGYEEQYKGEQAKKMYERIVKDCPGTDEADRAALDVPRRTIFDLFYAGDPNAAILLDKFIADFNQNSYAGDCLGRVVIGCYKRAVELKEQKQPEKAMRYREVAANIWERIQKENLHIGTNAVYLYFYVGANYLELRQWENTIENFQKVIDDYPDFEHACTVQTAMSYCYEQLRDSGDLPKEGVNPILEETYKAILSNYPGCYATKEISYRMAGLMLEKGDKTSASTYYKMLLQAAQSESERLSTIYKGKKPPPDKRIETVQAKLAELAVKGGNN